MALAAKPSTIPADPEAEIEPGSKLPGKTVTPLLAETLAPVGSVPPLVIVTLAAGILLNITRPSDTEDVETLRTESLAA